MADQRKMTDSPSKGPQSTAPSLATTTPNSWLTNLFSPNSKHHAREDDSGIALFLGNASLFSSPPPKEIRFLNRKEQPTPEVSPVSTASTLSSPLQDAEPVAADNQEQEVIVRHVDKDTFVERCMIYAEQARSYWVQGRVLIHRASLSPTCVTAFFWFNMLWTLIGIARFLIASTVPFRIMAPASSFMVDSMMEQTCSQDCMSLESMAQAKIDIENHIHRRWKPLELLELAARQISAGQAIVTRVQAEYEAVLADIERDQTLCRFPFAHVLNPLCPPALFDTETFVDKMSLF